MEKITNQASCRDRLLLIFGRQGCARRRILDTLEGENRFILSKEEVALSADVELKITYREGEYDLCGEKLCDRNPFYFETTEKEKLLLLLTKELSEAEEAGRMFLGADEVCQIGNSYRSRIFMSAAVWSNLGMGGLFRRKGHIMSVRKMEMKEFMSMKEPWRRKESFRWETE